MRTTYRKRRLWLTVPGEAAVQYYPVVLSAEKALLYRFTGRWDTAEQLLRTNLAWAERSDDPAAGIDARRNLSSFIILRGEFGEAQGYVERAIADCHALGDRSNYSRLLEHLGFIHASQGRNDRAMACYVESLAIAEELGEAVSIAHTAGLLGVVYHNMARYDDAMAQYRRQLAIAQQTGDSYRMSIAYGNIGNVYIDLRDFPKALECHQRSLHHSRIVGDRLSMGFSYGNIAIVHQLTGEYDLALEGHRKQLGIAQDLGDQQTIGAALVNIGTLQYDLGQFDQAEASFTRQLEIARQFRDRGIESFGTYMSALVRMQRRDYAAADRLLQQAIAIGRDIQLNHYLPDYLRQLATLYCELGNYGDAAALNDEARAIARQTGNDAAACLCSVLDLKLKRAMHQLNDGGAAAGLRALMEKSPGDEFRAQLLYELWSITRDPGTGEQALRMLRELYRLNKKHDYRLKIDELAAAGPS
ncbi:MAG TPA: tetratricopeptide repeat protein [Candidatus Edwardsbacteria bacterium]|nr:tetratricopeptide repeat protein [Candidatus Edwardsbacteria bacterium]